MTLYKQGVLRLLDAAITAPARPQRSMVAHLRLMLGRGSNFDRVAACLNLTNTILPGISRALSRRLYDARYLPFTSSRLEFLDYGSGGTVFLLEGHRAPNVIKIYRQSLGQPLDTLADILHSQRRKYERVSCWYNMDMELVPPGDFLIVNGPLLGSPVVALLQPYLAGRKKDLLGDFTDDELLGLFANDAVLRKQFRVFATRTIAAFAAGRYCFDLVGKANLMLIEHDEERRLAIVDAGVFDLQSLRQNRPPAFARMQRHITRLTALLARLDGAD